MVFCMEWTLVAYGTSLKGGVLDGFATMQAWLWQHWIYTSTFLFVIGAVVGSFLNVVIHRLPDPDLSIVRPRSRCPRCGATISWYDNIPILSFLILSGKCRECGGRISFRYPFVELLAGVLLVGLFLKFGPTLAVPLYFVFGSSLIACTFIDLDHLIIPNEISIPGIVVGIGVSFLGPDGYWKQSVLGVVVGGGGLFAITAAWALIRGKWAMGLGDVKLLAMIGAWLGWKSLLFVVLFSSLQGILAALVMLVLGVELQPPLEEEDEEAELERIRAERRAKFGADEPGEQLQTRPEDQGTERDGAQDQEEELEQVGFLGAAIPFGPFLALAAIEFLFLGQWFFNLLAGR